MAKPKIEVLVEVFTDKSLNVWASSFSVDDILSVEGVIRVHKAKENALVKCDPRYDINEIAEEVRDLLAATVPSVFRE